jgi:hypothetical protein
MRQRKEIAYPQMGTFVQPRPRGHHTPTTRHAFEDALQHAPRQGFTLTSPRLSPRHGPLTHPHGSIDSISSRGVNEPGTGSIRAGSVRYVLLQSGVMERRPTPRQTRRYQDRKDGDGRRVDEVRRCGPGGQRCLHACAPAPGCGSGDPFQPWLVGATRRD